MTLNPSLQKFIFVGLLFLIQSCAHQKSQLDDAALADPQSPKNQCEVISNFNSNIIFGSKMQRYFVYQIASFRPENINKCWSKIQVDTSSWCENFNYDSNDVKVEVTLNNQLGTNPNEAVAHISGRCVGSEFKYEDSLKISLNQSEK